MAPQSCYLKGHLSIRVNTSIKSVSDWYLHSNALSTSIKVADSSVQLIVSQITSSQTLVTILTKSKTYMKFSTWDLIGGKGPSSKLFAKFLHISISSNFLELLSINIHSYISLVLKEFLMDCSAQLISTQIAE